MFDKQSIKNIAIILLVSLALVYAPNFWQEKEAEASTNVFLQVDAKDCGNGVIESGEECDDGNNTNGDGCASDCKTESGSQPSEGGNNPVSSIIPDMINPLYIINIFSRVGIDQASVRWDTNKNAYCRIEWGLTQQVADLSIAETLAGVKHKFDFDNLTPETDYYFKIYCKDKWGHEAESDCQKLTTKPGIDKEAPKNVDKFTAVYDQGAVILTWVNPPEIDFRAVKILKSEAFYPQGINEGEVIYNDSGERTIDTKVQPGRRYYYTAFAYDNSGNYASGAITSIYIPYPAGEETGQPGDQGDVIKDEEPGEETDLGWGDFNYYAANRKISLEPLDGAIAVLPGTVVQVEALFERLPEGTAGILAGLSAVEYYNPGWTRNYLFRESQAWHAYFLDFIAPTQPGNYDLSFILLDKNNLALKRVKIGLNVMAWGLVFEVDSETIDVNFKNKSPKESQPVLLVEKAKINVKKITDSKIVRWVGEDYKQLNPKDSNSRGEYGFLVPNGDYMLEVQKNFFYKLVTPTIMVRNNVINANLEMIYIPRFDWCNFLTLILLLLIIYIIYKLTRRIIKNLREEKEEKAGK